MRVLLLTCCFSIVFFGCARARVDVGGTEKPIKVDVTMRVDIYQHVVKQADDIESMVRGTGTLEEPNAESQQKPQSLLSLFIKEAWAAELDPVTQGAVEGRKSRLAKVNALLADGTVGENNQGLLEVRNSANPEAGAVVAAENADREKIYADLAAQNGVSVEEIKNIYAEKMQALAPAGSPIQGKGGSWGIK